MNDFQFENLRIGIASCFKQNYCAMYLEDLVEKFCPEISEEELMCVVDWMYDNDQLTLDGTLIRLVVR